MKRAVMAAVSLALLAAPSWGDIIGSRPANPSGKAKAAVALKLRDLGVHPAEAREHLTGLSRRDLDYFAADPNRVALAGAQGQEFLSGSSSAMWYEFVIGVGGLLLGAGIIYYYAIVRD